MQAALGLHLQLGIYLGEGDSDVRLTPATRLEEYGVTQLVGIVANSGVDGVDSAGVIEEDATFTLTLNGGPGQGGSEYAVRVRQADTLDNLAVPDLIADIDRALAAAGLSGQVQARYDPEAQRLILLATGDGIHEMAVSTNEALGFRDQRDNLADLTITSIRVPDGPDDGNEPDDADTYRIDLHGAQTLEQVIEAVANETGGAVTLRIDADRPALIVAGPADEQLVVGAFAAHGLTSTTAVGLGILGTSGSNELRGQSLAHIGIADRIFLAEPDAGESTIELTLTLGADVDLRAALGLIGFEVASVEPIELGFTLPVRLRDPGVGDAQDGRITVSELLAGDVAALVDIGSSQGLFDGATLSGALELSADLFGQPAFSGPLATIRLSLLVPQDLTTVTITPENVHADLAQLGNLSPAQIVAMIRSFVTQLTEESETSPLLSTELPLVERSLGDIVQSVDEVLAWLDTIVASVDPTAIRELRDRLESAIVDLDRPRVEKAALFRALGALDRVLAADVADLPALLVSATAELRHAAEPFLAELDRDANDNPLLTELRDRLSGLQNLVPSLNTLAERLNAQLPDNLQITLDLPYYDANEQEPNEQERALVIGLRGNFAPDPWEFEPELPAFDVGPIELSVDASATLYASGSIGLGMGLRLGALDRFGSPGWENIDDAAFLIVNPPRDGNGNLVNPNLVPTQLELQAGFAVQGDGTVQFGGLELIEASADLSLLAAREETVDVEGSTATLPVGQVPRGGNPRFVIVAARGGEFDISSPDGQRRVTVLPPEYFEVIENQIRFFVDEHAEYHVAHLPPRVSVTYQTNDYPATPADPGNADQQASVTVDFGEPDINNNLLGAVAFADLFGEGGVQPRITAAGLLAGALDASFLGQHVEDAVTLAVALDHLTDPILTVDTARLTSIWDQLDFDLLSIFDGIEALLQLLENGLRHEVASQIPLIGDLDPRVIQDVREDFVAPIREFLVAQGGSLAEVQEKLQTRIFELLGRGEEGLGILGHRNEDGTIGPNGVLEDVQVELNKDRIEFQVILVGAETIGNVDFSSGLGGLPLEAQGGVSIDLGYTIIFGVGYHRTEGFYYLGNDDDAPLVDEDNQPLPEFSLDLDVAMQTVDRGGEQVPASLTLDLFLITFSATDRGDTGFEGTLSLDVDCGPGGHLRLSDLAERSFGEVFAASLSTVATIDLLLDASINDDLPHLTAELKAGFGFALTTDGGVLETHYGDVPETPGIEPYFALDNITLDLGDFLSKYLGPAITKVLEILQPVQEVVKWLTEPVPGVSDLSELVGGGPITLLDMVAWKEPEVARAARKFVNVVQSLGTITGAISTATADGIVLRLGGVSFFGDGLTTPGWNRDVQLVGAHPGDGEPDGGGVTSVLRDPAESVAAQLREGQLGDLTSRLQRAPDGDGSDDGLGIKLHFLELPTILKIVLGQTANVISWDIPTFAMDFDWDARFPVIPVPPISVAVGAHVGFTIDLSVGYDTRGLETGYFADGFFFGDLADVFAGDDIDEFRLTLGGTVAALLDVVVASAGIEGELRADLTANWRDPNQDGKMYLDEIARIINQDGPLCLFNLKLELHAILRLVWEVLFYSGSLDIVDFPV
ncbi:MAG: hypothetical protein MUF48_22885, partial [Pirellulaceae bacterium]|nr:hypothetical protein [Pirellulaceae bacterium]